MNKSTTDLCTITRAGASLKVNAAKFSTTDLCTIARAGGQSGAQLILSGTDSKSTTDLCTIARAGAGRILFEE